MRSQHSGASIFTYPLSRPFPFQWVTWVVMIGGVVLTTLFSFVAVAGNAYEFQSVYTTDPNTTISSHHWFQKAIFSWISNMEATCQPALLTTGGTYLTTNRGFVYTLEGMRSLGTQGQLLSAIGYRNTTLQNCEIAQITVDVLRKDNTRSTTYGDFWTWGATVANAKTTCTLFSESGLLQVNLTTVLPTVAYSSQLKDNFLAQNTSSNANSWYGIQIASDFYGKISLAMGYSTPDGPTGVSSWGTGNAILSRNMNVSDYKSADFFIGNVGFSTDTGGLSFMHPPSTIRNWTTKNDFFNLPNISITVDAFGKSLYSLLLLDFGVNDSTNALLSQTGVEYLQSINDTDLAKAANDSNFGTVGHPYDSNIDTAIESTTVPATLFSQYLCSVPKQKSGLSIFVAVVIADIVFLNACWTIFTWVLTHWLKSKSPRMMYCEGCMMRASQIDNMSHEVENQRPKTREEDEEILLQPSAAWSRSLV